MIVDNLDAWVGSEVTKVSMEVAEVTEEMQVPNSEFVM